MKVARNVAGIDVVVTGTRFRTLLWNGMFHINLTMVFGYDNV